MGAASAVPPRPAMRGAAALAGLAAAGAAYHLIVRPRMLRSGATKDEARRPLPGDALVPRSVLDSTRAITIRAPRHAVWPWLVQLGEGRGGFYSHDVVERLLGGGHSVEGWSAKHVHQELQGLRVGDPILFHPRHTEPVTELEPFHHLVIGRAWAFVLEDAPDGGTRLLVRTRGPGWLRPLFRNPLLRALGAIVDYVVGEPLHHVMEREMLRGIAARAEQTAAPAGPTA